MYATALPCPEQSSSDPHGLIRSSDVGKRRVTSLPQC